MTLIQVTPNYLGGADGIQNILNNYYEQQIASIGNAEEQLAARKLIEEGLIVDGARVSLAAAIVKNNFGIAEKLLEQLLHTRLIRVENTHLGRAYEVSHDTLVRPILKSYETRRLEEERLAQQRLLQQEQKKRRRFRLIAILGTLLSIAALVVLYIVWQQAKALEGQKQSLELSMLSSESSVYFSEHNYIGAFELAYQAYEKYQKTIESYSGNQLEIDLLRQNDLKQLQNKEPYIYRNIWSSFYSSDQLYKMENKIYSTPLPLVFDKAWVKLPTTENTNLATLDANGDLKLFDAKTKKLDSIAIPFAMDWLIKIEEGTRLISANASRVLFMDTTNNLVLLDRNTQKQHQILLTKEAQGNSSFLMQADGEVIVVFDEILGGITLYSYKGEQVEDFPKYQFLAIEEDRLYYQEMDFNQIGIIDLKTGAKYFISLPNRAQKLFVLDGYLAAELENQTIAKVLMERSDNEEVIGFKLLTVFGKNVSILDVFEKNALIVETISKESKATVLLWDMKSDQKRSLGESYADILRVDSLLVYLDQGLLRIYQPEGGELQLILPNEFEYTQMYSLENRFLCLPNIYQDKTLVVDFKMSPVQVDGPWEDQVMYSTASKDGKELLVISKTKVYIQTTADKSILAETNSKEGWDTKAIKKVELWKQEAKVIVQTDDYVWSWDYKTGKEVFFEGKCYLGNGYLCQMLDENQYKFVNVLSNEEIWSFEDVNIVDCSFSTIRSKKGEEQGWAILSRWNPNEQKGDVVFMDFKAQKRTKLDLVLGEKGSVDYSLDGSQAAVFDQNTQNLFILNRNGGSKGVAKIGGNSKVKWLNNEDLLVVNQKDIKILTSSLKKPTETEAAFENLTQLGRTRKKQKGLRILNEKSNKSTLDWTNLTPQLYKDYVFINRRYRIAGDGVLGAGFIYVPYHNRQLLRFPDFVDDYVFSSALVLSTTAEKAWAVSSFYKNIELDKNGFKKLKDYKKGYLLEFELNPHKLFDRLKLSKKAIEQLLYGRVMTIN